MGRAASALIGVALLAALSGCTAPGATVTPTVMTSAAPTATGTLAHTTKATVDRAPLSSAGTSGVTPSVGTTESDPNRPAGQCADSALRVTLSMPKGSAGSFVQDIVFTNTGSSSCVLRGAPGLSVVGDGKGTQLGAAAARQQTGAKDVRLGGHGGQAYARFGGPELAPGTEGARHCSGGVRSGDGYRVYPPHSTRAFFVRDSNAFACPTGAAFLHVQVVLAEGTAG